VVTLNCVEGWSVKILWEGVLVKDLLKEVDVLPGARIIIFYAHDGYSTSLPLSYIIVFLFQFFPSDISYSSGNSGWFDPRR